MAVWKGTNTVQLMCNLLLDHRKCCYKLRYQYFTSITN